MKAKILIFISLLVLNFSAAAQTKAPPKPVSRPKVLGVVNVGGKPGAWQETVSRQGGFKISFPGFPNSPQPPAKIARMLPPVNSGSYYLQSPAVYYNISFREHVYKNRDAAKLKEFYDLDTRAFLDGGYFELIGERDIALGEHLGRERVTHTDEGLSVNRTRLFLINGMFYELNAIVPKTKLAAEQVNVDKFFDSFHLTDAPPEKPAPFDYKTVAWRAFESKEAEFKAEFPGSPTRAAFPRKRGAKPQSLFFAIFNAGSEFTISASDYPYTVEDLPTLNSAYDNMTQFFVEKPEYQLISTKPVAAGKYPGREVVVQNTRTGSRLRARAFVVGKRLYQLIVSTSDTGDFDKEFAEFNEKNIRRFFDSFAPTGSELSVVELAARPLPTGLLGEIDEDGFYQNGFFGFSLELPFDWQLLNTDEIGAATEAGKLALGSPDATRNAALDAAYRRSIPLVTVSKKPFGTPENAMIWLIAEKSVNPALTPLDVARATESSFAQKKPSPAKIVRSPQALKFGSVSFAALEAELEFYGTKMRQKLLFTKRNGYDLTFIFAYVKEADAVELETALKSLKFKNAETRTK